MRYGNRRAGNRGRGQWPGNGPFRNLPPWERPGWLYGRGSCWSMGYQPGVVPNVQSIPSNDLQTLQSQKNLLEIQLSSLQERLNEIEKRLQEIQEQQ